jgi:hypothetical protein
MRRGAQLAPDGAKIIFSRPTASLRRFTSMVGKKTTLKVGS